jgi:ABC-type Fe3+ transport system substrate-binding protein
MAEPTVDEIYALALQEGALNIYAAGPRLLTEEWTDLFAQEYPGIGIEIKNGTSGALAGEIDMQRRAGHLQADIAILQTVQDFVRWKADGALIPVHPNGFDRISSAFRDEEGSYVGTQIFSLMYVYNSNAVAAGDVPRSAPDFLEPRFRGKVVLGYPGRDDVVLYLLYTIVQKYGWEFMEGLIANGAGFIDGHMGGVQKIASGEFAATFDGIAKLALGETEKGAPLAVAVSPIDPMPVWAQTAGIFVGCPHRYAAQLYLDWFLRREQQEKVNRIGSWSPRTDVHPPVGLKALSEYQLANDFAVSYSTSL